MEPDPIARDLEGGGQPAVPWLPSSRGAGSGTPLEESLSAAKESAGTQLAVDTVS